MQTSFLRFSHGYISISNVPNSLKKKLYNQCVLPEMTYASKTWTLTKALERRLAAAQRIQAGWKSFNEHKIVLKSGG